MKSFYRQYISQKYEKEKYYFQLEELRRLPGGELNDGRMSDLTNIFLKLKETILPAIKSLKKKENTF